jgi:hypothetical protein
MRGVWRFFNAKDILPAIPPLNLGGQRIFAVGISFRQRMNRSTAARISRARERRGREQLRSSVIGTAQSGEFAARFVH